ncbi:MAG: hypothetical protein NT178_05180 [Proteobacteria bacterium]|nr:hypothetical protein [Pseudomonadota bacterium]
MSKGRNKEVFPDKKTASLLNFCDIMCVYAQMPRDTAVDGAGSCRTFVALYCDIKKSLVHKNMPCMQKVMRGQDDESENNTAKKQVDKRRS